MPPPTRGPADRTQPGIGPVEKRAKLRDGSEVVLRDLRAEDVERSLRFFRSLTPEDRGYFRRDLTKKKSVEKRIAEAAGGKVVRIVALFWDEIVGDGTLDLSVEGPREHLGEFRVLVAREHRRKGLGTLLMRELHFIAARRGVEQVVAKVRRSATAARNICAKLGLHDTYVVPDRVRDESGKPEDSLILTCDMKELWENLEHAYGDADWERCR